MWLSILFWMLRLADLVIFVVKPQNATYTQVLCSVHEALCMRTVTYAQAGILFLDMEVAFLGLR